ncbi:hypothetical protein OCGS_2755 [Oceaniovalibus guishaninsula JLT2003]|uniref:Uncharacterized protein n=2 Tax=Oceaniovalibus TaxID=1207070 RepID=K2HJL2_9RHOB|nr:hypothetical protein OCGS_2755 [Oceaniovalibus guishaninsula JLT2003]
MIGAIPFPFTLLHVDPHRLERYVDEPHQNWYLWSAQHLPRFLHRNAVVRVKYLLGRKGVFGGNWDLESRLLPELPSYRLVEDLHRVLPDFRKSLWYARGLEALDRGRPFVHKTLTARTVPELDRIFVENLVALIETMKKDGYRQVQGADLPGGMIGRDGALLKGNRGRHRLAAAQVTGASGLYPIEVTGVHRLWLAGRQRRNGESRNAMLVREFAQVEKRYSGS